MGKGTGVGYQSGHPGLVLVLPGVALWIGTDMARLALLYGIKVLSDRLCVRCWHGGVALAWKFGKLDTLLQRIDVETTSLVDLLRYLLLVA